MYNKYITVEISFRANSYNEKKKKKNLTHRHLAITKFILAAH